MQKSMSTIMNSITVLSANCRGLQNYQKRIDVLNYFKETKSNIVRVQDTHWVKNDEVSVNKIWGNKCYINGNRTNSRGVATLLNNKF